MKKGAVIFFLIVSVIFCFFSPFLSDISSVIAYDNSQALRQAKNYLSLMAFSREGLIKQLKFEGFSHSEAEYAADNCGADWKDQAAKAAEKYLNIMNFSQESLTRQLESDGFTYEQALYGVSSSNIDETDQALGSAKSYLNVMPFSKNGLIKQLEYDGFSHETAENVVETLTVDWNEQASKAAKSYLSIFAFNDTQLLEKLEYDGFTYEQALYGASLEETSLGTGDGVVVNLNSEENRAIEKAKYYLEYDYSRQKIVDKLVSDGFSRETAEYAVDNCNADWNQQAVNRANYYLEYDYSRQKIVDKLVSDGFSRETAEYAVDNCNADWNQQAVNKAKYYLEYDYSRQKIIDKLVSDGFSHETAEYAVDNCNADWNQQAINRAKYYLEYNYSRQKIVDKLVSDGFTHETAEYAVDNCNVDGNQQAVDKAKSYLKFNYSRQKIVDKLVSDGFSYETAEYAVDNCDADWNQQAVDKAKSYLKFNYSRQKIIDKLVSDGFSYETAVYGADNCNADWNQQAVNMVISYLKFNYSPIKIYQKLIDDKFTNEQALFGVDNCGADWILVAYNKALSYVKYNYSDEKMKNKLTSDGFTDEQVIVAIHCLNNPSCNEMNIDLEASFAASTLTVTSTMTPTAAYTATSTISPLATFTETSTSTLTATPTVTPPSTYTAASTDTPTVTLMPISTSAHTTEVIDMPIVTPTKTVSVSSSSTPNVFTRAEIMDMNAYVSCIGTSLLDTLPLTMKSLFNEARYTIDHIRNDKGTDAMSLDIGFNDQGIIDVVSIVLDKQTFFIENLLDAFKIGIEYLGIDPDWDELITEENELILPLLDGNTCIAEVITDQTEQYSISCGTINAIIRTASENSEFSNNFENSDYLNISNDSKTNPIIENHKKGSLEKMNAYEVFMGASKNDVIKEYSNDILPIEEDKCAVDCVRDKKGNTIMLLAVSWNEFEIIDSVGISFDKELSDLHGLVDALFTGLRYLGIDSDLGDLQHNGDEWKMKLTDGNSCVVTETTNEMHLQQYNVICSTPDSKGFLATRKETFDVNLYDKFMGKSKSAVRLIQPGMWQFSNNDPYTFVVAVAEDRYNHANYLTVFFDDNDIVDAIGIILEKGYMISGEQENNNPYRILSYGINKVGLDTSNIVDVFYVGDNKDILAAYFPDMVYCMLNETSELNVIRCGLLD